MSYLSRKCNQRKSQPLPLLRAPGFGFIPPAKMSPSPPAAPFPSGAPLPLPGGPLAKRAASPGGPLALATPDSGFSSLNLRVCLFVGFGGRNVTLETSTHPAGVETFPPTTGALLSTMICFLRPASSKPPASPTLLRTSSLTVLSSSLHSGFSVLASFSPLVMTTMGPLFPATVNILGICCLRCHSADSPC